MGDNTVCATNGINAYDSSVQLADETYQNANTSREDMIAPNTNELNQDDLSLVETFVDNSGKMIDFFIDELGVEFRTDIQED